MAVLMWLISRAAPLLHFDVPAHQWLAAIDALGDRLDSSDRHLSAFCSHVPGHTIESLRATERSRNPVFVHQRDRFYEGLRRAGLG